MTFHSNRRPWCVFPLRPLVEDVVRRQLSHATGPSIQAVIDISVDQMVRGDRELLRRAVHHLVLGAVAAMPAGGCLVATSAVGHDSVELEIADTGPSLPDVARRRNLDPLRVGRGAAVGQALAIVRRIAELHGGRVFAANCPEGGVAFTLQIPCPVLMKAAA